MINEIRGNEWRPRRFGAAGNQAADVQSGIFFIILFLIIKESLPASSKSHENVHVTVYLHTCHTFYLDIVKEI